MSWLCKIGIHKYLRILDLRDGRMHIECKRCLKEKGAREVEMYDPLDQEYKREHP